MAEYGYGLPLRCPQCPEKDYFGMLKVPGTRAVPCPNCGTALVALRKKRRQQAVVLHSTQFVVHQ